MCINPLGINNSLHVFGASGDSPAITNGNCARPGLPTIYAPRDAIG